MRVTAGSRDFRVCAYAGSTGVLLAFDIPDDEREGLLGFAIEERRGQRPFRFLQGKLPWEGESSPAPDESFRSDTHPFQKFRWSDYTVEPGRTYHYRVRQARDDWRAPTLGEPVEVTVRTHSRLRGGHEVRFNRAAAASQAFARQFPEFEADLRAAQKAKQPYELPAPALDWLSRGAREAITGFIDQAADATWALDIAIYEYELDAIVDAVRAAAARGADVRLIYHARPGDPQTAENQRHLRGIPARNRRPRVTPAIFHDKFIVASRLHNGIRQPVAVLAGSTNFTANGVYRQANVVHVVRQPATARRYLALFSEIFGGADPVTTKQYIETNDPIDSDGDVAAHFSPRGGEVDLARFIDIIGAAEHDVVFATAFDMKDSLEDALLGEPHDSILRLGITNLKNNRITGYHRDRSANFVATALMRSGLEGFLRESYAGQTGNIHIHTKVVVVDFTSAAPTIISGSHNFSHNASAANDENYLIVSGRPDLADCYAIELLRFYDHYRARFRLTDKKTPPPILTKDHRWTAGYWDDELKRLDRLRFAHPADA